MVMADDDNSDFVASAAEQKVTREPPQIRSPDIKVPEGGQPFTACCPNKGKKCSYNSYLFGRIALQYDGEPRSAKAALELPRQPG